MVYDCVLCVMFFVVYFDVVVFVFWGFVIIVIINGFEGVGSFYIFIRGLIISNGFGEKFVFLIC